MKEGQLMFSTAGGYSPVRVLLVVMGGCLVFLQGPAFAAQHPDEAQVRAADQTERQAILHGDRDLQLQIWAEELIITNTAGESLTRDEVLQVFDAGVIPYRVFERTTEQVRLYGDVALSFGHEAVIAAGAPDKAVVHRRYTHVWLRGTAGWQLVARHAGVATGQPPRN